MEAERTIPSKSSLEKLAKTFENADIDFSKNDGVKKRDNPVIVFYNYLDVFDDAISVFKKGQEIVFNRADDRRSSPEVIEKMNKMREMGFKFRSTIHEDNSFIWGNKKEYRHMNKKDFANSEVQVVYADRFVIHVPAGSEVGDTEHFIIIKNKQLAKVQKTQFENDWSRGKCLP